MQLSDEALDNFVAIYEKKFNEPISRDDAAEMAQRLVTLYRVLLLPLPPEVLDQEKEGHQAEGGPTLSF